MTPLDLQFYNLAVMVLAGVALGLCLDTYRVLRGIWRPGWLGTAIGDLVFGLFCGLLLAVALIVGNSGELRLYVFLGILAGYGLYQELGGRAYRRSLWATLTLIIRSVRALVLAFSRLLAIVAAALVLLLQPFFWLADVAARLGGFLARPFAAAARPIWGGLARLGRGVLVRLGRLWKQKE